MEEKLEKIDHIAINVHDIESSINWYLSSSNCKVIFKTNTEALLQFDNIRLALVLPSQTPPHIAFNRNDAETLGHLREQNDGKISCFVSDPAGNLVELCKV